MPQAGSFLLRKRPSPTPYQPGKPQSYTTAVTTSRFVDRDVRSSYEERRTGTSHRKSGEKRSQDMAAAHSNIS